MSSKASIRPVGTPYPAITDYAFLSDCHSLGMVARDGTLEWMCFHRFDNNPVFACMLDREQGGFFRVAPVAPSTITRRYLPDTNILETRFATDTGVITVTDCLPCWEDEREPGKIADIQPRHLFIRLVRCEQGEVEVAVTFSPRFDFGRTTPYLHPISDDLAVVFGGADSLLLHCNLGRLVSDAKGGCDSREVLKAGDRRELAIQWERPHRMKPARLDPEDLRTRVERTEAFWRSWASRCTYTGPHRDLVVRSLLVLKGLTYSDTGAIIAAGTTSLPEEVGGVRNWDYRFSWLRDSSVLIAALGMFGYRDEARRFARFLLTTTAGRTDELQILYGIGGERFLIETDLKALDGYKGSKPVRIGNGAFDQFQMDTYGELVGVMYNLVKRLDFSYEEQQSDPRMRFWMEFVKQVVDTAARRWNEPDDGIWETRGGRQHFVFSKVMAWLALDRGIILFERLPELKPDLDGWRRARDDVRRAIEAEGVDPETGAFVQAFGQKALDATALQILLTGFLPPDDPRVKATVERIDKELTREGHVYRYIERNDGLAGEEGTFTFCTLWLATSFAVMGDVERAEERLAKVLEYVSDLGLCAEEIDPVRREALGNTPQAFSHAGLIQAILAIEEAREARKKGVSAPAISPLQPEAPDMPPQPS
ncbi:glycoside hydrolase family 15 protein [Pyxidicoccus parkwayensis]|uniref:Glycoside hydrolase family 15 protein n=1 Tax=Pyxidicoccus parkwayensis TaxID=2813578 RepID=A0ABX7P4E1_9BACT|nr:glycoside hydrolase family 15 protein [Pyxidicoccus parkwaysis]QSQ25355.1 glycoside hydrolase family 15 protein [Pyxidicoccus parkwaysis]